jgi:hypothetical protein
MEKEVPPHCHWNKRGRALNTFSSEEPPEAITSDLLDGVEGILMADEANPVTISINLPGESSFPFPLRNTGLWG